MADEVEYKDVVGSPGYRMGDDGSLWSRRIPGGSAKLSDTWRLLKPTLGSNGYLAAFMDLGMGRKRQRIHRLILSTFVGPRSSAWDGCHNNGIRTDNRLSNLRWDTRKGNAADTIDHGRSTVGESNPSCILTEKQVCEIIIRLNDGEIGTLLAKEFGVTGGAIYDIKNGRNWKHLDRNKIILESSKMRLQQPLLA